MARGLVEPEAMKAALQASLSGSSLSEILVERGAIGELDLARTLAEHHRLDHVDLELFDVDGDAATLVDAAVARRLGAVPIAFLSGGELVVAMYDPNSSPAVREIAQLVDRSIQPAVASRSQIEALIDSLPNVGQIDAPRSTPAAALATAPEKRLRAVPAAMISSTHPADVLRPTAPAPVAPPPTPMETRNDNDERVRAAEELSRVADARAQAADERAAKAGKLVAAANSRAEGLMAAATAANEALARLVGNCEVLERDAKTREAEMQALRSELESERAERVRLESRLLEPQADEELLALNVRIAELERELGEERAAARRAPPPAQASFAPPAPAAVAPPVAYVAPVAPVVEAAVVEEIAVAPVPVAEPEPAAAPVPVPVQHAPAAPVTIDILGEPGVPYVSALAPMPPIAEPAKPKNPKNAAKARGLRRLIGALKRG